jgi:predicted O-methyltransferase YrrM
MLIFICADNGVNTFMDHFYENIDGFMNHRNLDFLNRALDEFPQAGTWVELGSWTGKSAAYCAVELINRNKIGPFYCVDSWLGGPENYDPTVLKNLKPIFENNIAPIAQHITPIEGMSWDAAQQFKDGTVDFCYVDAGHTYECVTNDLQAWWPKIRPGAIFGGDDYTKGYPGLQQAVWDFFKPMNIKVSRMGRCWVVRKPA